MLGFPLKKWPVRGGMYIGSRQTVKLRINVKISQKKWYTAVSYIQYVLYRVFLVIHGMDLSKDKKSPSG